MSEDYQFDYNSSCRSCLTTPIYDNLCPKYLLCDFATSYVSYQAWQRAKSKSGNLTHCWFTF